MFLLDADFSNITNLALTAGMLIVSVTSVFISTRNAVGTLREQSATTNSAVGKLNDSVIQLNLAITRRDEQSIAYERRISACEDEIKRTRENAHALRNWLLNYATEAGHTANLPEPK